MSASLTFWAWTQVCEKSTHKLVLLCLANHHNESTGQCNPAIKSISESTTLDRKTVIRAIASLDESGLINIKKANGSGNYYSFNQYQKRDCTSTKKGISQKGDCTSTKNGTQPVPKTGHEPKKNLKRILNKDNKVSELNFDSWAQRPSAEIWTDYKKMRAKKKADITQTVINTIGKQLNILIGHGYTADDIFSECVTRNWTGLKVEWIHKPEKGYAANQPKHKQSTAEKCEQQTRILQAKLKAGDFDKCSMGSNDPIVRPQVDIITRGEDDGQQPVDAEFYPLGSQIGSLV